METIQLYSSKKKAALLLLGSLVFVAGGMWMVLNPSPTRRYSETFVFCMGIIAILFFGMGIFVAIWQLIKDRLALTINEKGLIINHRFGQTVIDWDEIKGFSEYNLNRQKFVVIQLKKNDYHIKKETSSFKKRIMKLNVAMYGSPYALSSSVYKINHNELLALLQKSLIASQQIV